MNVESEKQTVFIVDDNTDLRHSLSQFLSAAELHTESYSSAKAFLAAYDSTRSGCLLLDIKMPEMSGLELQEQLMGLEISLPIIFMSGQAAVMDAVQAMKHGSYDFIEKPHNPKHLLTVVRSALSHDLKQRAECTQKNAIKKRYELLTPREKQILAHVVSGLSSKQIANECGLSVSTVDNHRANIMKKMEAETTADFTRMALIVDPSLGQKIKK